MGAESGLSGEVIEKEEKEGEGRRDRGREYK